ncbi:MAG: nitroreductase family protein [Planctomycetes bacterium]|nr:nitroreductase family protein [Planctomycetota bacterium]MBM3990781.1 nitroreductase family protein [Planctomycetota bacterium]
MSDSHSGFVPLLHVRLAPEEALRRAREFCAELVTRRSVRHFSSDPLPDGVLDLCIAAAASAPSGANKQPWSFVVVKDPATRQLLRHAVEEEERRFYAERISAQWREDLRPIGTSWEKPYVEEAPALIVVFRQTHGVEGDRRMAHYYTQESVGIAVGFLLAALHHAGIATLTHTPAPMQFLERLLQRPANERAFMLIPVGYPAEGCRVPNLPRKSLDEVRVVR